MLELTYHQPFVQMDFVAQIHNNPKRKTMERALVGWELLADITRAFPEAYGLNQNDKE